MAKYYTMAVDPIPYDESPSPPSPIRICVVCGGHLALSNLTDRCYRHSPDAPAQFSPPEETLTALFIQNTVLKACNITLRDILISHARPVVHARHVIAYLIRNDLGMALKNIAPYVGIKPSALRNAIEELSLQLSGRYHSNRKTSLRTLLRTIRASYPTKKVAPG